MRVGSLRLAVRAAERSAGRVPLRRVASWRRALQRRHPVPERRLRGNRGVHDPRPVGADALRDLPAGRECRAGVRSGRFLGRLRNRGALPDHAGSRDGEHADIHVRGTSPGRRRRELRRSLGDLQDGSLLRSAGASPRTCRWALRRARGRRSALRGRPHASGQSRRMCRAAVLRGPPRCVGVQPWAFGGVLPQRLGLRSRAGLHSRAMLVERCAGRLRGIRNVRPGEMGRPRRAVRFVRHAMSRRVVPRGDPRPSAGRAGRRPGMGHVPGGYRRRAALRLDLRHVRGVLRGHPSRCRTRASDVHAAR
jgi:hypothetical protein